MSPFRHEVFGLKAAVEKLAKLALRKLGVKPQLKESASAQKSSANLDKAARPQVATVAKPRAKQEAGRCAKKEAIPQAERARPCLL